MLGFIDWLFECEGNNNPKTSTGCDYPNAVGTMAIVAILVVLAAYLWFRWRMRRG